MSSGSALHGGSVEIIMTTEERVSPPTTRECASLETTALFQVSMPEPFTFSRPEEWIKWICCFEIFGVVLRLALREGDIQVSTLIYGRSSE